jgi:hypothetical protein
LLSGRLVRIPQSRFAALPKAVRSSGSGRLTALALRALSTLRSSSATATPTTRPTIHGMAPQGTRAYRAALVHVVLQNAPVVQFRYVAINPESLDTDFQRSINGAEIWGMCLPDHCAEGLGRGTRPLRLPGSAHRRANVGSGNRRLEGMESMTWRPWKRSWNRR